MVERPTTVRRRDCAPGQGGCQRGRGTTAQETVTDEALCCLQGEQESAIWAGETSRHTRRQVIYLDVLLAG